MFENLVTDSTCSYKITAHSGAPGFNLQSNIPTEDLYVAWVEYDLETVTAFDSKLIQNPFRPVPGMWPNFNTTTSYVECNENCKAGDPLPRSKVNWDDGTLGIVDAFDILDQISEKQAEIDAYLQEREFIEAYNMAIEEDVVGGLLGTADTLRMPSRPDKYDGDSIKNTAARGGYGRPTSGHYDVKLVDPSGFKPYGSAGQTLHNDMSLTLQDKDKDRVMITSIVTLDDSDFSSGAVRMEVGAYPLNVWNFDVPSIPEASVEDKAALMFVSVATATAVMSLY